jgi:3-isopropylmalate dehydrogenase
MTGHEHTVACLAGGGVGPELMAETSRALAEVSRLHNFRLDEVHVPFGSEALSAWGHPLPPATRTACRSADAVLVAGGKEPALQGVRAELELSATVMRIRSERVDLAIVSPLDDRFSRWTVERAFALARERRAHVTSIGSGHSWRFLVEEVAELHPGMETTHLTLAEALPHLAGGPGGVDVVLTEQIFAEAVHAMVTFERDDTRAVAIGDIAERGPGVFRPIHGPAAQIAGFGVANPSGMLLAASLLLEEGLGERAAGYTLSESVASALRDGARTPDMVGTGAHDTRGFMDAVLARLPRARTDTEFGREVVA